MKYFLLILFSCVASQAVTLPTDSPPNFFVATNGAFGNNGRLSSPIDIYTLILSNNCPLKTNTATFWLRGGNYLSTNQYSLSATGITIRPYPGEIPILQGGILIQGYNSNNVIRGLNLMSGEKDRSNMTTNFPPTISGLYVLAGGVQTIGNYVVGFSGEGLDSFIAASNTLHYGDIYLNNGYEYDTNLTLNNLNHGHSAYLQNQYGNKTFAQCHLLYSVSSDLDIRGTSLAKDENIWCQSNFVANGFMSGRYIIQYPYDVAAVKGDSGTYGLSNVWFTDNMLVHDGSDGNNGSSWHMGQENVGTCGTNYGLHVERNYAKSGFLELGDMDSTSTVRSNTIWTDFAFWAARFSVLSPVCEYAANAFGSNNWFFTGGSGRPWQGWTNGAATVINMNTLGDWQGNVIGDSNATYSASAPSATVTKVWPNNVRDAYDQWWGDVAVWNPNLASKNVTVALTGLPANTPIDVKYTGNILGPSVLTTSYNGSSITIPMTNLPTIQPNDATWPKLPVPTNGASFRIFLSMNSTGSVARITNFHVKRTKIGP